jgi:hypothetical protein
VGAGTVDLLVWETATSRAAVVSEYAALAAGLTGLADPDAKQAAAQFLAWLATTQAQMADRARRPAGRLERLSSCPQ